VGSSPTVVHSAQGELAQARTPARLTCAVELELGVVDRLWSVCVPLAMIKALTKIAQRSERLVRRLHGESNGGFEECT
jgi:hypothetical protein